MTGVKGRCHQPVLRHLIKPPLGAAGLPASRRRPCGLVPEGHAKTQPPEVGLSSADSHPRFGESLHLAVSPVLVTSWGQGLCYLLNISRRKNAVFCVCSNAWSAAQRQRKDFVLRTGRMQIRPLFFPAPTFELMEHGWTIL